MSDLNPRTTGIKRTAGNALASRMNNKKLYCDSCGNAKGNKLSAFINNRDVFVSCMDEYCLTVMSLKGYEFVYEFNIVQDMSYYNEVLQIYEYVEPEFRHSKIFRRV